MIALPFLLPSSTGEWQDWLGDEGPRLLAILIVVITVRIFSRPVVGRVLRGAGRQARRLRPEDEMLVERRVKTLEGTVGWAVTLTAAFIGLALALDVVGMDATALIAGFGVAGIAVGLGAQTLIKDVITGMFILLEDQYSVGDVVRVADVSGVVVDITPRRTVLRDLDGNVHSVPNSEIRVATNMTRDFSRINLDFSIAYEEDIARAIAVANEECARLAAERADDVIAGPAVLRVNALGESGVDIKVTGDVRAGKQWELTGILRWRIHDRFGVEGISIPYPHQVQVPYRGTDLPQLES
ncbi:MAG: mechanosensitive ion channel family protein [Dehalococcoidia bacterium]|nr:mechanosensitive ion channel family protein [Dehalococcoidia bacterium]MCB9486984.1 mechanosensitive ion channel family protein [Thermoflexaceae bacterium]